MDLYGLRFVANEDAGCARADFRTDDSGLDAGSICKALPLDKLVNRNLLFYSGQTPVVEFGSDRLFVIPVNLDPAKRHAFRVRSFVVQS